MEDSQEFLGPAQQTGGRVPREAHGSPMRQDGDTNRGSTLVGHPMLVHGSPTELPWVSRGASKGLPCWPVGTPMCL